MEIYLKYIVWILTTIIPFVGAWFFNYTEDVKDSNQKKITKYGKFAIVGTILGIFLGFVLMKWEDNSNADDSARRIKAEEDAAKYRKKSIEFYEEARQLGVKALEDRNSIIKLLSVIRDNTANLPVSAKNDVLKIIENYDDIGRVFPDLHARLEEGYAEGDFDKIMSTTQELLTRQMQQRIKNSTECNAIGFRSLAASMSGFFMKIDSLFFVKFHVDDSSSSIKFHVEDFTNYTSESFLGNQIVLEFSNQVSYICEEIYFGKNECSVNFGKPSGVQILQKLKSDYLKAITIYGSKNVFTKKFSIENSRTINSVANCIVF